VQQELARQLDALEGELARLEGRGARGYDAAGCDCVRALLEHAEQLAGEVGERLSARAAAHLDALRERFERDRSRVAQALEQAERALGELPALRRRLSAGELSAVARALRRRRAARPSRQPERRAALDRTAEVHALRRRRQLAYEDSVAQLVASLALARATDGVPADAGPYNPLRIASQVLDRMREISPFYLTVQLNRLEELASLLELPELPAPSGKALPKRPSKAGKR
jgi:Protein of unknown function (DUF2894)